MIAVVTLMTGVIMIVVNLNFHRKDLCFLKRVLKGNIPFKPFVHDWLLYKYPNTTYKEGVTSLFEYYELFAVWIAYLITDENKPLKYYFKPPKHD